MNSSFFMNFAGFFLVLGTLLAFFFGMFLYWRSGKRELVENKVLFDVIAVFILGGLIMGRLTDFVVRPDFYGWSFNKLIFFNAYGGLDIFGAFLGGLLFSWIYLRRKKESFWDLFDYASAGCALAVFMFLTTRSITEIVRDKSFVLLTYGLSFFVIFWVLKRLEKQKRHRGFFASFFLVFASMVNIIFILVKFGFQGSNYHVLWLFFVNGLVLIAGLINWYILSKRKILTDGKNIFGFILLTTFKIKRILTNIREADNSARALLLSPFYLGKSIFFLVKYVGREMYLSFFDLLKSFGVGK